MTLGPCPLQRNTTTWALTVPVTIYLDPISWTQQQRQANPHAPSNPGPCKPGSTMKSGGKAHPARGQLNCRAVHFMPCTCDKAPDLHGPDYRCRPSPMQTQPDECKDRDKVNNTPDVLLSE